MSSIDQKPFINPGAVNQQIQTLQDTHKHLEKRLGKLNKRKTLTPQEELEKKKLQKEKLLTKDQMALLLRQHRSSGLNDPYLRAKLKRN
ncbi:MAG TPA: hypothetical protein VGB26_13280 [Nitrospiria bacterium]|jgi:uncharacterized protein YdcH (DUF465 family)